MKFSSTQKFPPTTARSVALKYPQQWSLSCIWILTASLWAAKISWNSARWRSEKNQMKVPMITTPRASRIKSQLRIIRPFVTWFGWIMAPTETAQVTNSAIARTRPAKKRRDGNSFQVWWVNYETGTIDQYSNVLVKSVFEMTRFLIKSGDLHTIERMRVMIPAASRQKSVNAQKPTSFFEGIFG